MTLSPALATTALLLDLDGTLLDIAPTPDAVVVPDDLLQTLRTLLPLLGGALAVVSGRPVEQVDALLRAIPTAVAGEHGGAIRRLPGAPIERANLPTAPAAWYEAGEKIATAHPGALFERKQRGFVLHYRLVPEAGPAIEAALRSLMGTDEHFALMPARKAWELKPKGADKGTAVRTLMAHPPFAGRAPLFVGDDVTDLDGIAAAIAMGGSGLRVGDDLRDPPAVRRWLCGLAGGSAPAKPHTNGPAMCSL